MRMPLGKTQRISGTASRGKIALPDKGSRDARTAARGKVRIVGDSAVLGEDRDGTESPHAAAKGCGPVAEH
jgi:hypothetical protein